MLKGKVRYYFKMTTYENYSFFKNKERFDELFQRLSLNNV